MQASMLGSSTTVPLRQLPGWWHVGHLWVAAGFVSHLENVGRPPSRFPPVELLQRSVAGFLQGGQLLLHRAGTLGGVGKALGGVGHFGTQLCRTETRAPFE